MVWSPSRTVPIPDPIQSMISLTLRKNPMKLLTTPLKLLALLSATTAAFAQSVTTSQSSFTAGQPVQVSWTGASGSS